jgi:hypothetical protein
MENQSFIKHCDAFRDFEALLVRLGSEQEMLGLTMEAGELPTLEQLAYYNELLTKVKAAMNNVHYISPEPSAHKADTAELHRIDEEARKKRRGF